MELPNIDLKDVNIDIKSTKVSIEMSLEEYYRHLCGILMLQQYHKNGLASSWPKYVETLNSAKKIISALDIPTLTEFFTKEFNTDKLCANS